MLGRTRDRNDDSVSGSVTVALGETTFTGIGDRRHAPLEAVGSLEAGAGRPSRVVFGSGVTAIERTRQTTLRPTSKTKRSSV